tara:strand:- start:1182 stop:1715 length:534 start_codon:yes stop_codon:yes gene_type:complete
MSYQFDSGIIGMKMEVDYTEAYRKLKEMDKTASQIMQKAMIDIVDKEASTTIQMLKGKSKGGNDIYNTVIQSLVAFESGSFKEAKVTFGSDPIEEGGVTGSRGGKLAQILEDGMAPHKYAFQGMEIDTRSGKGFINALRKTPTHPGIPATDWLKDTQKRAQPKFEQAIADALQEAWE